MDQTRKMWASAAVVGVIIVGGASVAAAASAGKLDQVARETRAEMEKASPSGEQPSPESSEPAVVSTEVNPDPQTVLRYWSDQRMEDAQPMPMPEVGKLEIGDAEPGGQQPSEGESGEIAGQPE